MVMFGVGQEFYVVVKFAGGNTAMAPRTKLPVTCPVNDFARMQLAASAYPPTKARPQESNVSS
jgi:hypothetical protein